MNVVREAWRRFVAHHRTGKPWPERRPFGPEDAGRLYETLDSMRAPRGIVIAPRGFIRPSVKQEKEIAPPNE